MTNAELELVVRSVEYLRRGDRLSAMQTLRTLVMAAGLKKTTATKKRLARRRNQGIAEILKYV